MFRVVTYLLPLSGEMLLQRFHQHPEVTLEAAFVPETYYSDCSGQIQWLKNHDIPYRVPDSLDDNIRSWVTDFDLDFGLSVGYDKKLPEWLFSYPDYGTINLHPSLLPDYRGANPYFWVLRNQEESTGVTLHYMDGGFDTGPIIKNREVSVETDETMGTLFFKLNRIGLDLLEESIEKSARNKTPPEPRVQPDASDVKKAPKVEERHLRIDWDQPAGAIDAHVRAANPFLGSFTTFKGSKIRVYEVEPCDPPADAESAPSAGRIHATPEGPCVRCESGWLRLTVVQVGQRYKASGKVFQQREQKAFDVLNKVI